MNGHFVKMQGAGNDFILIDNRRGIWPLDALHLRRWCDRRLGVGADQLLVLEETRRPDADFRYRIFNADGGEVEQCGNGARCMTRWVLERIFPGECVRFETMRAVIRGSIGKDGLVSVEMGMPILEADDLPFRTDGLSYCGGAWRGFGLSGTDELCVLAVGNPHAVRFGPMPEDEVFRADLARGFVDAVTDVLAAKLIRAMKETKLKRVVVAGGVSANRQLRERLISEVKKRRGEIFFPPMRLCTDNGAMIAAAGLARFERMTPEALESLRGKGAFGVKPRWQLTDTERL